VSSSNKREREVARAKYERQQARRAEREMAAKKRTKVIAVVASLVVVLGAVGAWAFATRDTTPEPIASPTTSPSPSVSPSGSASPSASPSPSVSNVTCTEAPEPTTKTQTWTAPPGIPLKPASTYFIELQTNCGTIDIEVDQAAPETADSMIFLANQGFYTDSDCFRLTTAGLFVLQCGSPSNNGQGGPGFTVPDENLPADTQNNYPAGTVAMANAGPGTAGSQFFIVYEDTTLPPNYTIWGKVVSGLDVVRYVAEQGVQGGGADGAPVQPIVITKATTRETTQVG
jgi:peptidyl-prolyl cis-trans isomerase B (cyclophilin B)